MRTSLLALALLTGSVVIAAPAAAVTTFSGVSTGVTDPDTGLPEQYTVTLVFADGVAPIIFHQTTINAPFVNYDTGYRLNLLSATISGPRYTMTVTDGYSRVSTLDSSRRQDGTSGFSAAAGSDGTTVGYSLSLLYYANGAFSSTDMPTALDPAAAFDAGFNLTEYYYDGDPADEIITSQDRLNFRFASGGIVPAAAPVPEPATWAMMIAGFGMVGGSLRYRRCKTAVAYA